MDVINQTDVLKDSLDSSVREPVNVTAEDVKATETPAATTPKPARKKRKATDAASEVTIPFTVPESVAPQLKLICLIRNQKSEDVISEVLREYVEQHSDQIASKLQKYITDQAKELQSLLS